LVEFSLVSMIRTKSALLFVKVAVAAAAATL